MKNRLLFLFLLMVLSFLGCLSSKVEGLSLNSTRLWQIDGCGLMGYRDSIFRNNFGDREGINKIYLNRDKKFMVKNFGKPNTFSNHLNEFEYYLYIISAVEEKGRLCDASMDTSVTFMVDIKTQKIIDIYYAIY